MAQSFFQTSKFQLMCANIWMPVYRCTEEAVAMKWNSLCPLDNKSMFWHLGASNAAILHPVLCDSRRFSYSFPSIHFCWHACHLHIKAGMILALTLSSHPNPFPSMSSFYSLLPSFLSSSPCRHTLVFSFVVKSRDTIDSVTYHLVWQFWLAIVPPSSNLMMTTMVSGFLYSTRNPSLLTNMFCRLDGQQLAC